MEDEVVGLQREAEVLAVSLATGCHVVLEGPPGVGKSTLLRAVAGAAGIGLEFVEGNAELTPARLIGHHDPALVLEGGYRPEAFVDGPLVRALRAGSMLYLEELNRVPEETLNVLVGALAEGEIHVPRLGRIPAGPGFRLVAAMNPFDAVGTARVSQAISDRMCRIALGYQDAAAEGRIVARATATDGVLVQRAVEIARLSREHTLVRMGASVRGAIDLVRLASGLTALRGVPELGREAFTDAAVAALSGRLRLEEGSERTPEEVVRELVDRVWPAEPAEGGEPERGKAPSPPPSRPAGGPARGPARR